MRARRTLIAAFILSPAAVLAGFGSVVSSFLKPLGPVYEGLAWDGRYLWAVGAPSPYAYRLTTTGSVVYQMHLGGPAYSYWRSAAFDGNYLWFCWHRDFDPGFEFTKFTTTGSELGGFGLANSGAGLASEPPYLWAGKYKVTTTGSIVSTLYSPVGVREPAWYGHYLWTGKYNDPYVYKITTTGYASVVASFRVPGGGDYADGMTFDGNYLWLAAHGTNYCYQIDIDVTDAEPASFGKVKGLYR